MDELRKWLVERRAELQADMNAVAGALQQIDYTLKEIERIEGEGTEVVAS